MRIDFLFRVLEISLCANSPELCDYERLFREWDDYLREYAAYTEEYEKNSRDSVEMLRELQSIEADEQDELLELIEEASREYSFCGRIVDQDDQGLYFEVLQREGCRWLSLAEFDHILEKYIRRKLRSISAGVPPGISNEDEELSLDDLMKVIAEKRRQEAYALLMEEM
jgi:hypothetical protein